MSQTFNPDPTNGTSQLPPPNECKSPLFSVGQVVATPAVLAHFAEHRVSANLFISRHQRGDWGEVSADDKIENNFAALNGLRILSAYEIAGERVWIITEADRSSTCVIFQSEY